MGNRFIVGSALACKVFYHVYHEYGTESKFNSVRLYCAIDINAIRCGHWWIVDLCRSKHRNEGKQMVRLLRQNNTEEMFFMFMVAAMDRRVPAPASKKR